MRPYRLVFELTTDQPEKFAVVSVDPTERHEGGGCKGTVMSLHVTLAAAKQALEDSTMSDNLRKALDEARALRDFVFDHTLGGEACTREMLRLRRLASGHVNLIEALASTSASSKPALSRISALIVAGPYPVEPRCHGAYIAGLTAARDILAASSPNVTEEPWQPIETAPKGNGREGPFFDVIWAEIDHPYLPVRERRIDCYREGDMVRQKHGYPSVTTIFQPQPTHWRPSPSPPAALAPEEGRKT